MNTNRLRFGCTLTAATLAIGSFAAYMPEAEAGGVAIRLSTEHATLSLNEPVVLQLHFKNLVSSAVHFDLGLLEDEYVTFHVRRPNGTERLVRFGDMPLGCVDDCDFVDTKFTLAPGQEYLHRFVLSDWHRFDALGDYRIVSNLERAAVVDIWNPANGFVTTAADGVLELNTTAEDNAWLGEAIASSNGIVLRVLPRDAQALRGRAERLLGIVLSRGERWAEKALRRMVDPVAIPAWERMALVDSHRRVAALEGLVELGTPAAVEALARMVDTLDA